MATDIAFDLLRAFVAAQWPDQAETCPISWDNEPFTPPPPYDDQDRPQHWLKVLVDGRLWDQQSIGTGDPRAERWVETGELLVLAMVPVGTGSRLCRQVLRAFAEMCRGDTGSIEFGDVTFPAIGSTDDAGNWWSMQVIIEWKRG
ncbi:hypothetical protein [Azospirillum thermophilum]|uniref:DUF3168 domain-containing protein n=1 Tax=Azospirillum thermophilum TaxID=2202148 RepID=A0A2S2D149_9PROT|nr:hypothetical protein [Azospirillum thermophilum]AWK90350.1 hypothetical protein DEW08_30520 [Azospirillum thermophilum]